MIAWFSSLRLRLLVLVVFTVVPTLGLVGFYGREVRRQAASDAQQRALELIRHASLQHQHIIQDTRNILVALVEVPDIRERSDRCAATLATLLKQYPQFTNLAVTTPAGGAGCSALPNPGGGVVADRKWFQEALRTKEFAYGDYVIGRISGKAALLTGLPVLDAEGNVDYLLHAGIDLSWLNSFLEEFNLPPGSRLAATDQSGVLLARWPNPQEWIGRSTASGGLVGRRVAAGEREGKGEGIGAEGVARLYAFTPLSGLNGKEDGVFISVAIPTAAAYAYADELVREGLTGIGLALLGALGLALLGSEVLLFRRLGHLVATSHRLAGGDLAVRTGIRNQRDELGRLAGAFDHMATSLQARNEERSRLMEQVESERATFGSIVTSMTQGVIMVDYDDRVRYCSALAGRLLHLDPTTCVGRPVDETLRLVAARAGGPAAAIPAWDALRERIGDYPTFDLALRATSQDLRLDFFPITLESGGRSGFGILIRDVTAERDVSRAKDALISIVSHELRTPLASIRSFSELLLTYDDPEVRQEFLGVINAESERLSRLLNETLDLAKIEAGTFDLNTTVFDPGPVLAECAKTYAPLAAQQKVHLAGDDLSALSPVAMNPDRLIQVVFNLLDNALKFTQEGEVRLGAKQMGGEVWITVSDTGVGIAAADLDRIFERFHQAGSVTSGKPSGLGLGLSLCREIVHRYGGRIWAESQERRGSTFYVALPLAAPAAPAGAAAGVGSVGS